MQKVLFKNKDILSSANIKKYLGDYYDLFRFDIRKTVTSTNTILRKAAMAGDAEGLVVIAEEQTDGHGKFNRKFYSNYGSGVYMSLLLRPKFTAMTSSLITAAAATAVAEAIEDVSNLKTKIKWVNDILINDKKVCGILTEGAISSNNNGFDYIVLGIGVNVFEPSSGFNEEIRDIAGAVFPHKSSISNARSKVIASILKHFWNYYKDFEKKNFFEGYKKRSCLINKNVVVTQAGKTLLATVLDIDENCRLVLKYCDGTIDTISSGEVKLSKL